MKYVSKGRITEEEIFEMWGINPEEAVITNVKFNAEDRVFNFLIRAYEEINVNKVSKSRKGYVVLKSDPQMKCDFEIPEDKYGGYVNSLHSKDAHFVNLGNMHVPKSEIMAIKFI